MTSYSGLARAAARQKSQRTRIGAESKAIPRAGQSQGEQGVFRDSRQAAHPETTAGVQCLGYSLVQVWWLGDLHQEAAEGAEEAGIPSPIGYSIGPGWRQRNPTLTSRRVGDSPHRGR